MEKVFSNVIFYYEEQDENLIEDLNREIEENIDKIYSFFDSSMKKEMVNIYIVPTKKEFDRIFKEMKEMDSSIEIPKWLVGWSSPEQNIYWVSIHDYQNTSHAFPNEKYDWNYTLYKKGIIHEYVHFVNRLYCKINQCSYTIPYLSEGLACYLSGKEERNPFSYTIEDILESNQCYGGWYKVTKYLIDHYSHEKVLEFVREEEKAKQFIKDEFDKIKSFYMDKEE